MGFFSVGRLRTDWIKAPWWIFLPVVDFASLPDFLYLRGISSQISLPINIFIIIIISRYKNIGIFKKDLLFFVRVHNTFFCLFRSLRIFVTSSSSQEKKVKIKTTTVQWSFLRKFWVFINEIFVELTVIKIT